MKEDYTYTGLTTPEEKREIPGWLEVLVAAFLMFGISIFLGFLIAGTLAMRTMANCLDTISHITKELLDNCNSQSAISLPYIVIFSCLVFAILWFTSPERLKNPLRFWNRWYE